MCNVLLAKCCIVLPLLLLLVGCTSFRSSIMQRYEDDRFGFNCPKAHAHGLPVKLKVPTHLEVVVSEDFFIEKIGGSSPAKAAAAAAGGAPAQEVAPKERATFHEIHLHDCQGKVVRPLSVTTEVIYTDKVFTVDFKRPAGGILTLSQVTFDKEQYFASITATYEERTLADINTAITTLKPILGKASVVKINDSGDRLATDSREVARARFDLAECDWEDQMHAFVDHHITGCYDGCELPNLKK